MLTLATPAKINWTLHVLGRRPDGYHDILSLIQCVGLFDTLTFEPSDRLEIISPLPIPVEQNLVYRAAEALGKAVGISAGARITLVKEIPSGAGLGGGSSDAAATLKGLNRFWGLGMNDESLIEIGASIGSDVPFFFSCPMALVQGRGELLTPMPISRSVVLVIVKPRVSVPTGWAYSSLAEARAGGMSGELTKIDEKLNNIKLIIRAVEEGRTAAVSSLLWNDFSGVVMERFPVIADIRNRLLESGATAAMMSGSGAAVFGIFEDRKSAMAVLNRLRPHWSRVAETLCDPA